MILICQTPENSIFDTLINIGILLTSISAFASLFIIRKQRKDFLRPNLLFQRMGIAHCFIKPENEIEEGEKHILKIEWYSEDSPFEDNRYIYKIINAGNGVAENVLLFEEFNMKKAIDFIKENDKQNEFIFTIKDTYLEITTTFDDTFIMLFDKDGKGKRELGYVLTHMQDKSGMEPVFNATYLTFLSCYDYLRSKYDEYLPIDDFPPLFLKLKYSDIAKHKYNREFQTSILPLSNNSYIININDK